MDPCGFKYVGKSVPRTDGYEKVTGQLIFGVDLEVPGMLHAKLLRSPYAHAKIKSIDTSKAEKLPGVKAVVTAKDYPGRTGAYLTDTHIYAKEKVIYVGDVVAAVAAEDVESAEEALDLIEVEYEELPALFTPEEAMKPDAIVIHPDLGEYKWYKGFCFPKPGTNISNHFKLRRGDVEKGFAEADYVFEDHFDVPMIQHAPLEPHAAVVQVSKDNKVTCWSNTQGAFLVREMISKAFGFPFKDIRVIASGIGGAFGAKIIARNEILALPLALKTHRPVKLVFTRPEEFIGTFTRQGLSMTIKTGVKKDGRMTARQVTCLWDGGAFADYGVSIARSAGYISMGPYNLDNIKVDSYCVYTNKPAGGAFRGFGVPETHWGGEQQIDMIAERLGIDPVEMRLINAYEEGSYQATGSVLHSVGLKACLRNVERQLKTSGKAKTSGKLLGKGIACMNKFTAHTVATSAVIKINEDSTIMVETPTAEIGQGTHTVLTQIIAEVLDIPPEKINIKPADTDFTPFGWQTAASKNTFFDGNAVKIAAEDVKAQLQELASLRFGVPKEKLIFSNGTVFPEGVPGEAATFGNICWGGQYPYPVIGKGVFSVRDATFLDEETGQGARCSAFWMFASQGAEVNVDPETGEVEVVRMVATHDAGTIINPMLAESQIEGALAQGVGAALMEELVFDAKGKLINDTFTDYKMPTSLDMPEFDVQFVESAPHKEGPYGAKGLGEPGLAPTAPAIANAVYDACKVRITDQPITSEKVWRALKEANKK